MKNVVLIGASGFVGSALLEEALQRGHKVTAVVLNPEKISISAPNLTVLKADATCPDTLAQIAKGKDAVISAYNPGWGNPRQYEETLENYPKIVEGESVQESNACSSSAERVRCLSSPDCVWWTRVRSLLNGCPA